MAKKHKKFTAKDEPMVDLAHGESSMPKLASTPKRKWYPTLRINKKVRGFDKVGTTKTVKMRVRVNSIEMRDDEPPSFGLEVQGIEQGE
jgi:hypothetical protein